MKRLFVLLAALAAFLAVAGVATAATGNSPNYGASNLGGASGNGTQVTHYSATYTDSFFGPVSCVGVNQVKLNKPTQDSFTCTSTSGLPLTNVSPGQVINWGPNTWQSDYNQQLDKTFTATVSSDGMSYSGVATY